MKITKEDMNNMKTEKQFVAAREYVRNNEAYLREKYQKRFMAILDSVVIDTDEDPMKLWGRVSKKQFEERNFDIYPVIGSVNSFLADNSILEKILFGENGRIFVN